MSSRYRPIYLSSCYPMHPVWYLTGTTTTNTYIYIYERHAKKKEEKTHSEETKQASESDSGMTQILNNQI